MIKRYLVGIILLLLFILGVLLAVPVGVFTERVESRIFCAYDKVFVEFTDGKYKWGTMLLDDSGIPMPCKRYIDDNTGSKYGT